MSHLEILYQYLSNRLSRRRFLLIYMTGSPIGVEIRSRDALFTSFAKVATVTLRSDNTLELSFPWYTSGFVRKNIIQLVDDWNNR